MNRREFLKAGAAASVAVAGLGGYVAYAQDEKPLRVGLIGAGWYGKVDLFRLIQVAPVEVVSLCDVDKRMVADAAEMVEIGRASCRERVKVAEVVVAIKLDIFSL